MAKLIGAALAALMGVSAASLARAEPHTLTMIVLSEDADGIQKVAEGFRASHPDVTLKLQTYPWDSYFQTAQLRLNAKDSGIDLVYVDAPLIASYASRGFLASMDKAIDTSALVPSSLGAGQYKGVQYGLPINNSAQVLFYNRKIFATAGVAPPEGLTPGGTATQAQANEIASAKRWTWEQVAEAGKKLTVKKGGTTTTWGFEFDQVNEIYQLQPLGESLGTDVISPDGKTAEGYLDSSAWTRAATFYAGLYNDLAISPKGVSHDATPQLFANGQVAMFAGGTWNIGLFQKSGVDFGVAAFPYFSGGKVLTPTGSWFVGVTKGSKNQELATAFAQYLTVSPEGTKIWFEAKNQLPASKPMLEVIGKDTAFDAFPRDVFRIGAYDALNTAKPRPSTVAFGQLQDAFRTAFDDISNGVPVADALKTAVKTYDNAVAHLAQ